MKVGDNIQILFRATKHEQGLGNLRPLNGHLIAHYDGRLSAVPSFWLVEVDAPTAIQRLGGWSGVAVTDALLQVVVR